MFGLFWSKCDVSAGMHLAAHHVNSQGMTTVCSMACKPSLSWGTKQWAAMYMSFSLRPDPGTMHTSGSVVQGKAY